MQSFIDDLQLIDHHCHGVVKANLDRDSFEALMSEGDRKIKGCTQFDKPLGLMIQRWCSPVLGLPEHSEPEQYFDARGALSADELTKRFVGHNGVHTMLIDTGHKADAILNCEEMHAISGVQNREIVRIEAVMEEVARSGVSSGRILISQFVEELSARAPHAAGLKSIVAYRTSFAIDQSRPTDQEAIHAADQWLIALSNGTSRRLEDETLIRFALWQAGDLCEKYNYPIQLHVGFGDKDINMPKCDPSYFIPFIAEMEKKNVPICLLHCYPFVREAGWLAEVYSNVYMDIGVMQNFTGPSAHRILRQALEVTPFYKQQYSSDAFGLPEYHYLGARLFRNAFARVLNEWISQGDITTQRAEKIAYAICAGNSKRIYHLD